LRCAYFADILLSRDTERSGRERERERERVRENDRVREEEEEEEEEEEGRYCRQRREKEIVKSRHTAAASIDVRKLFKQIIANTPADQFYGQIRFTVQR